jgi:hypothetical protein
VWQKGKVSLAVQQHICRGNPVRSVKKEKKKKKKGIFVTITRTKRIRG